MTFKSGDVPWNKGVSIPGHPAWNKGNVGTKTHCPTGHPYDKENSGYVPNGTPYCKECKRIRTAAYRNQLDPEIRKAKAREHAKRVLRKLRALCIEQYGSKCACCGESTPEFLHLDHINNDGAAHRRELLQGKRGSNSLAIMRWAKDNNFPKDRLQLLCHNCGMAKGFYGNCPHQSR